MKIRLRVKKAAVQAAGFFFLRIALYLVLAVVFYILV